VRPEKHAAFRRLARHHGQSDSKLLTLLIDHTLRESALSAANPPLQVVLGRATERLTVRLRPKDAERVHQRAQSRGMRSATYLAYLIHAHVTAAPSVPVAEIAELKRAVASLTAIGRNLNQLVKASHQGQGIDAHLRRLLPPLIGGIEQVHRAVKDYTRANLSSWDASHG
jgi:hypothetical protein